MLPYRTRYRFSAIMNMFGKGQRQDKLWGHSMLIKNYKYKNFKTTFMVAHKK